MKRQRGRGRRPGGGGGGGGGGGQHHQHQHPNRAMESSGPEIKVRGPASHIYERYLQLSRDAAGAGDRVLSENYAQHADHYFRLVRSMQPATPPPPPQNFNEGEYEGDEGGAEAAEMSEGAPQGGHDQQDVDFPSGEQQQQQSQGDGDQRGRRRGRRNRYRGDGERGEGETRAEGGEARDDEGGGEQRAERQDRGERTERPERQERRERQPREREEQAGPEGFSSGPKPAFLRDN
ncbi:MAG: DUF4167 domain-containing protein [Vitreimonas sp.]